jgi:hypothetical protein
VMGWKNTFLIDQCLPINAAHKRVEGCEKERVPAPSSLFPVPRALP